MRRFVAVLGIGSIALAAACADQGSVLAPQDAGFNKKGQEVCQGFGDGTGESGGTPKIDTDNDPNAVFVSAPSGYLIDKYCVKAGNDVEIVPVNPPSASIELTAPNGKAVSHYALSFIREDGEGQWCSPGYWKNHSIDAEYAAALDDPNDPLLPPNWRDILASPSQFGGEMFNQVGSILSHLHPDVDFALGDIVIHNCPLGGRAN